MTAAESGRLETTIRRWRRLAGVVLLSENLTLSFWPAACALVLFLGLALTGIVAALPPLLHVLVLGCAIGGIAWLAVLGRRGFAAPGAPAAERRLERDSNLRHRPLAALRDRPAGDAPASLGLWTLHQRRARDAVRSLRLAPPDPILSAADPYAVRAAATVLLVAGLIIAGPEAASRIGGAVFPHFGDTVPAVPPLVQAWVMPPAYTGLPPFLLPAGADAGHAIDVPTGSKLTVSVTGIGEAPAVTLAGDGHAMEKLGGDNFESSFTVTKSGHLRVGTLVSGLSGWDLHVLPNDPPAVSWTALPGRAGSTNSTKFPWAVSQRWGVAALQVELVPKDEPTLPPLILPLPLPGTPKQAKGAAVLDLESQPLAGLTMNARLAARDVAGQAAEGASAQFVLPSRVFHHPLAKAIIDVRRRLALHPDRPNDAAADLLALAGADMPHLPPGLHASGVILNLGAAAGLLRGPHVQPAAIAEAQQLLWTLALGLDGALGNASARALAQAQERMRQALEERALGKLSDKDLQKQLDALREALAKRMQDLGTQALKKGALEKFDPHTQHLSSAAMDQQMRQLEQALRENRMEDAKRALAQLQQMFEQLNSAHIMSKQEMQAREQAEKRAQQMTGAVQDMVRRELKLLDHAQARSPQSEQQGAQPFRGYDFMKPPGALQPFENQPQDKMEASPENGAGQAAPQPGEAPGSTPPDQQGKAEGGQGQPPQTPPRDGAAQSRTADARTQRALHRALDTLSQDFQESGGKKPPSLDDAGSAMRDAARSLDRGNDPEARDAMGRAIAALQQGGQEMNRQMSSQSAGQMQLSLQPGGGVRQSGTGEEGEDNLREGRGGRKKDPFGRQVEGGGTIADDPSLRVPDQMEQGRSRAIQDELRRRGADRQRSQQELDYINRLLKPF